MMFVFYFDFLILHEVLSKINKLKTFNDFGGGVDHSFGRVTGLE